MRLSLAGNDVDWTRKTSSPRTFSWISTKTSMSAKRLQTLFVMGTLRWAPMASAKGPVAISGNELKAQWRLVAMR